MLKLSPIFRGYSSVVELHVANVVVAGSSPVSRSIFKYRRKAMRDFCIKVYFLLNSALLWVQDLTAEARGKMINRGRDGDKSGDDEA